MSQKKCHCGRTFSAWHCCEMFWCLTNPQNFIFHPESFFLSLSLSVVVQEVAIVPVIFFPIKFWCFIHHIKKQNHKCLFFFFINNCLIVMQRFEGIRPNITIYPFNLFFFLDLNLFKINLLLKRVIWLNNWRLSDREPPVQQVAVVWDKKPQLTFQCVDSASQLFSFKSPFRCF